MASERIDSSAIPPNLPSDEEAERFRRFAENAFDLISEFDEAGTVQYLSPSHAEVLGWHPGENLGAGAVDMAHPDDRPLVVAALARLKSEGVARETVRARHADGSWRWLEGITRMYRTSRGEVRFMSIARDVTERRMAENQLAEANRDLEQRVELRTRELTEANARFSEQLVESELLVRNLRSADERWRSLVEHMPAFIMICDPDGTIQFINRAGQGYTKEQIIGAKLSDLCYAEERGHLMAVFHGVCQSAKPGHVEGRDAHGNAWYVTRFAPVVHDGIVSAVIGIATDITAKKQLESSLLETRDHLEQEVLRRTHELAEANKRMQLDLAERERVEKRLRESEERFRAIAEALPMPVLITRMSDGQVLYANQRVAATLGRDRDKLIGQLATDFYVNPGERAEIMERLARDGFVDNLPLRIQPNKGNRIWALVSCRKITFDEQPAALAGFLDVTRRREAELRSRRQRRHLREMIHLQDRERQLITYEIHDGMVQDMAAAAMFFESAGAAKDGQWQAAYDEGLRLLRGAINEARRLIDGLRPPILDEAGPVAAIEHLIAETSRHADLEIEFKPTVRFKRLTPALENNVFRIVQEALTNVWRHSGSDRAEVKLIEDDDRIRIVVRDWGVGFDVSKVPKTRFGLAGLRQRARLFGGKTTIRTKPGGGTTIAVELPLTDNLSSPPESRDDRNS